MRFQAHLPLLRGLLDSDLRVKQSAIDVRYCFCFLGFIPRCVVLEGRRDCLKAGSPQRRRCTEASEPTVRDFSPSLVGCFVFVGCVLFEFKRHGGTVTARGYLFAHLFTQCRYHDVSAVKVLLKGLMRAQLLQLERQDAVPLHLPSSTIILESADVMGPAPADFCDASLPFWFPVEEKHRALLLQNSDFLSFLLLLRYSAAKNFFFQKPLFLLFLL